MLRLRGAGATAAAAAATTAAVAAATGTAIVASWPPAAQQRRSHSGGRCRCARLNTHRAPCPARPAPPLCSFKLNLWDVGGQRSLRPYWRNYYEKTDGLVWVVDAADLARLSDCRAELAALLQEERLLGSSLLVLSNKQDVPGALGLQELTQVGARRARAGQGRGWHAACAHCMQLCEAALHAARSGSHSGSSGSTCASCSLGPARPPV